MFKVMTAGTSVLSFGLITVGTGQSGTLRLPPTDGAVVLIEETASKTVSKLNLAPDLV